MNTTPYKKTWEEIKSYLSTRVDLFKLGFLEKSAKIIGMLLFALVLVLLLFAIVTFGCLALIYAIGQSLPMWASALIVGGLWIVMLIVCIILRKQLFINPILAAISAILFKDEGKQQASDASVSPTAKGGAV